MKKYLIPGLVVVVFLAYLLFTHEQSSYVASGPTSPSTSTVETSGGGNPSSSNSGSSVTGTTPAGSNPGTVGSNPAPTPKPSVGTYKDGTYKGSVADAYFGNLQVEAVIQGGKLVDCIPLQYPSDSGHSAEVSKQSLPVLKQEALQSQSANVDIVSGATQTSQAYQESLAVALTLAKN